MYIERIENSTKKGSHSNGNIVLKVLKLAGPYIIKGSNLLFKYLTACDLSIIFSYLYAIIMNRPITYFMWIQFWIGIHFQKKRL